MKRQKIRIACQECRDRKIRCDGARPICHSCQRKNLSVDSCVYLSHDTSSSSRYVRGLEERIHELEVLQSHSSGPFAAQRGENSPLLMSTVLEPSVGNQALLDDGRARDIPPATCRSGAEAIPPVLTEPGESTRSDKSFVGDTAQTEPEATPVYLGSSSAIGFMAEVRRTLDASGESFGASGQTPNSTASGLVASPWIPRSQFEGMQPSSLASGFMVPPKPFCDQLVNSYWLGAHPLQPFIHHRSFMERYKHLWSSHSREDLIDVHKSGSARAGEQLFQCMLNSILALGCRFWAVAYPDEPAPPASTERYFINQADRLLDLDLMEQPSTQLVQVLLLMVQCLTNLKLSNKAWVLVGMAVRSAQAIEMSLDSDGESQYQSEERRKTWWMCVLLDRVQSMTFGRPLMLEAGTLCPFPLEVDEAFLNADRATPNTSQPLNQPAKSVFFVRILKLSNITADILRLAYPSVSDHSTTDQRVLDYDSLFKADRHLEAWHEELPGFLNYDQIAPSSDITNIFVRQAHLIHHRYLHSKILLFRRIVVQLAARSFSTGSASALRTIEQTMAGSCVDVCTTAAQALLEALHPHLGTKLVPPAWFTILLIYTAGTAMAIVSLTPSFREKLSMEQSERLQQSWARCIECLRYYEQQQNQSASSYLKSLEQLFPSGTGAHDTSELDKGNIWTLPGNFLSQDGTGLPTHGSQAPNPQPMGMVSDDNWFAATPQVWWPDDDFNFFISLAQNR